MVDDENGVVDQGGWVVSPFHDSLPIIYHRGSTRNVEIRIVLESTLTRIGEFDGREVAIRKGKGEGKLGEDRQRKGEDGGGLLMASPW